MIHKHCLSFLLHTVPFLPTYQTYLSPKTDTFPTLPGIRLIRKFPIQRVLVPSIQTCYKESLFFKDLVFFLELFYFSSHCSIFTFAPRSIISAPTGFPLWWFVYSAGIFFLNGSDVDSPGLACSGPQFMFVLSVSFPILFFNLSR